MTDAGPSDRRGDMTAVRYDRLWSTFHRLRTLAAMRALVHVGEAANTAREHPMSTRIEIGRNLYLTHGDEGMSDYLLISAHGLSSGRPFVVPAWTRLHYYAPRDRFLVMDMSKFNLSAVVEEEIDGGNHSPDYLLSKYQGRHGAAGETYASLGVMVDQVRNAIAAGPTAPPAIPANIGPNLRNQLLSNHRATYENLLPFDILTIRNRSVFKGGSLAGIPLSEVLAAVGAVHRYAYICCSFCRGSIGQGISDTLHDKTGGRIGTDYTHRVRQH